MKEKLAEQFVLPRSEQALRSFLDRFDNILVNGYGATFYGRDGSVMRGGREDGVFEVVNPVVKCIAVYDLLSIETWNVRRTGAGLANYIVRFHDCRGMFLCVRDSTGRVLEMSASGNVEVWIDRATGFAGLAVKKE
mgnify:CR=1 FL=1